MNGVGGYRGFGGYSGKDRERYGLNDSVPKGAALRLGRQPNQELPFPRGKGQSKENPTRELGEVTGEEVVEGKGVNDEEGEEEEEENQKV